MVADREVDPALHARLMRTASDVLRACQPGKHERLLILSDRSTATAIIDAFAGAMATLQPSLDAVSLSVAPRRPAFADLPEHAVEALLAADLVLDLTSVPWLYSDSFTRYAAECRARGSRLALIWGEAESMPTLASCPPSPTLASKARRGLAALNEARTLQARAANGTEFFVELGDPVTYQRAFIGEPPAAAGMIGAPLCASVTAPFVPGTARGTLVFAGAGRFQGPENLPIRPDQPATLTIEGGRVTRVQGDGAAALALSEWFASAVHEDVYVLMDCNIGFDSRADLATADNTVVHSYSGGMMVGFGNPYTYRPGYHLDLMFPGLDVDLDETPFIRGGEFVAD